MDQTRINAIRSLIILGALLCIFTPFVSSCSVCHMSDHSCPEPGHGPCYLEHCCNGHSDER